MFTFGGGLYHANHAIRTGPDDDAAKGRGAKREVKRKKNATAPPPDRHRRRVVGRGRKYYIALYYYIIRVNTHYSRAYAVQYIHITRVQCIYTPRTL